jgi:DNA polymerase V
LEVPKTLIANEYAKQHPETGGVCLLDDPEQQRSLLSETEVSELWDIGRQWTKLLNQQGITTALQLRNANEWWVKHSSE